MQQFHRVKNMLKYVLQIYEMVLIASLNLLIDNRIYITLDEGAPEHRVMVLYAK
jgi:hypothetical protein